MAILKDEEWVRHSFMIPQYVFEEQESARRALSDVNYKFTDTTLGGNFAINPPPQFCKNADIRIKGRFSSSEGMGRYYSEALDDHGQFIHMRFGVPTFNSLINFYSGFYDNTTATLANRGRATSVLYKFIYGATFVVTIPIHIALFIGKAIRFFQNKPTSRYYYLKPAMPLYWSAVANIVNLIGVNMGVIGPQTSESERGKYGEADDEISNAERTEDIKLNHKAMSKYSIFREDGGIDIFSMATRAHRLAHKNREDFAKAIEKAGDWEQIVANMKAFTGTLTDDKARTLKEALKKYHETPATAPPTPPSDPSKPDMDNESAGDAFEKYAAEEGFVEYAIAELEDGSAFVTFRVDNVGTVQESFRSSVGESQIAGMINSMASSSRGAKFGWAGGNLGDGALATLVESIAGSAVDAVKASIDASGLGGLIMLTGTGYADIPKVWQNSSADLPGASYTIELRSPYGTPLARFQNIVVPLAMLLAGVLPLSTGKQSYTSPFLCEIYCKGRNQIRLGMIESMSITRGTGNLGWSATGEPLGIDITFSIVDLSNIMHMPIAPNFNAVDALVKTGAEKLGTTVASVVDTLAASNFDDDNAFMDYMAVLGSLGLEDQIYPQNKLRLRKAQRAAGWEQWKSPARWANWLLGDHPAWAVKLLAWAAPSIFRTGGAASTSTK